MRMYHLPPHAFACLTARHGVFLDLRRDGYFSVSRPAMEELIPWIQNWQPAPRNEPATRTRFSHAADTLASELLAEEMLSEGPAAPPDRPRMARAAGGDLESMPLRAADPVRKCSIWSVASALLYSKWALRMQPIAQIVDAVSRRRRSRSSAVPADWNEAGGLTAMFLKYRPLFPRDYLCLFDSLALVRFLSRYDLYPDWVFGVQEDPFSAHCWVQAGAVVLNDHFDNVAGYTPIMTV